jgi:hypothetical protein
MCSYTVLQAVCTAGRSVCHANEQVGVTATVLAAEADDTKPMVAYSMHGMPNCWL